MSHSPIKSWKVPKALLRGKSKPSVVLTNQISWKWFYSRSWVYTLKMNQDSKKNTKTKLLWATSIFPLVKIQAMFWYSFMDMTEHNHDTFFGSNNYLRSNANYIFKTKKELWLKFNSCFSTSKYFRIQVLIELRSSLRQTTRQYLQLLKRSLLKVVQSSETSLLELQKKFYKNNRFDKHQ